MYQRGWVYTAPQLKNRRLTRLIGSNRQSISSKEETIPRRNKHRQLFFRSFRSFPPYNSLVKPGFVKPDTTRLIDYQSTSLVPTETVHHLLSNVKDKEREQTVIHWAALRGDLQTLTCTLDRVPPEKRYELIKIQDASGQTAIHIAACKGHSDVITCILDYAPPDQQIDLLDIRDTKGKSALDLALQFSQSTTAELVQQRRATAIKQRDATPAIGRRENAVIAIMEIINNLLEKPDSTCHENGQIKQMEEKVTQQTSQIINLTKQSEEYKRLLQEKDQHILFLTTQSEKDKQTPHLSSRRNGLTACSERNSEMIGKRGQEISEERVYSYENYTTMKTCSTSDDESSDAECDYDEHPIPPALVAELKSFCAAHQPPVTDVELLQSPKDYNHILLFGLNASKIVKKELDEVIQGQSEWHNYVIEPQEQELSDEDSTEQHGWDSAKIERHEELGGTCELLVEAEDPNNSHQVVAYAVGAAHTMFEDDTNRKLQQKDDEETLKETRGKIEREPPSTLYKVKFKTSEDTNQILDASHPPYIAIRYRLPNRLAGVDGDSEEVEELQQPNDTPEHVDFKRCLNDMVLLCINSTEAQDLHDQIQQIRPLFERLVEMSSLNKLKKYLRPPVGEKGIPIVVREHQGYLVGNGKPLEELRADRQPDTLKFELTDGRLEAGHSGSIVYEVTKNGRHRPLGMYIGVSRSRQDKKFGTFYKAVIIDLALKDIVASYPTNLKQLSLFNTRLRQDLFNRGRTVPSPGSQTSTAQNH